MPTLRCPCGTIIGLSSIPNPAGFSCFPEARLEELIVGLAAAIVPDLAPRAVEKLVFETFVGQAAVPHAYECSACGRVAVFRRASDAAPAIWLRPEDPASPRLTALSSEASSDPVS